MQILKDGKVCYKIKRAERKENRRNGTHMLLFVLFKLTTLWALNWFWSYCGAVDAWSSPHFLSVPLPGARASHQIFTNAWRMQTLCIKVDPIHCEELVLYLHRDVSAELHTDENNSRCIAAPESFLYNNLPHLQSSEGRRAAFVAVFVGNFLYSRIFSCKKKEDDPRFYFRINKSINMTKHDLELQDHRVFNVTLMLILKLKLPQCPHFLHSERF